MHVYVVTHESVDEDDTEVLFSVVGLFRKLDDAVMACAASIAEVAEENGEDEDASIDDYMVEAANGIKEHIEKKQRKHGDRGLAMHPVSIGDPWGSPHKWEIFLEKVQ